MMGTDTGMSARIGKIDDPRAPDDARGMVLATDVIIAAALAVFSRADRHGRATGHPSKVRQSSICVGDGGTIAHNRLPSFAATAIDREPAAALIAKLRQLPYFRQAYDFDGMAAGEFSQFAAFATTATEFAAATRKTVDFVARAMEGRQTRVA